MNHAGDLSTNIISCHNRMTAMESGLVRSLYQRWLPRSLRKAISPILNPRITLLRSEAIRRASGAIISGPFKGLKFGSQVLSTGMILGVYEIELHEVFERLADRDFSRIIDIGAAEGYYAVGSALWKPQCEVIAFEANTKFHPALSEIARCNAVNNRIRIKGACELNDLLSMGDDLIGSFIIVDVEGYEKVLLDPQEISALRHATVLVEVHDNFVPGCEFTIRERFKDTHDIAEFKSRDRLIAEYPIGDGLCRFGFMKSAALFCSSDHRSEPNSWLLLEPKAN